MNRIKSFLSIQSALLVSIVITLGLSGYVAYQYKLLGNSLKVLENDNIELTNSLDESRQESRYLLQKNQDLQNIVDSFDGQIQGIASTVGTLEKLSQTDKELLRKYSKVYFLSENYLPAQLTNIDKKYLYNKEDI